MSDEAVVAAIARVLARVEEAYVLGEAWTEPEITAPSVTSDGFVTTDAEFMGGSTGDVRLPTNWATDYASSGSAMNRSSTSVLPGRTCWGGSRTRPGKPLRDLLRAGAIENANQDGGRFWFIRCASSLE